jgi:hypothetical protein
MHSKFSSRLLRQIEILILSFKYIYIYIVCPSQSKPIMNEPWLFLLYISMQVIHFNKVVFKQKDAFLFFVTFSNIMYKFDTSCLIFVTLMFNFKNHKKNSQVTFLINYLLIIYLSDFFHQNDFLLFHKNQKFILFLKMHIIMFNFVDLQHNTNKLN